MPYNTKQEKIDFLKKVISEKSVIEFMYEGMHRIVEPFTLGYLTSTTNLALAAWQSNTANSASGKLPAWRLYLIDKMTALSALNRKVTSKRPSYNPNDKRMIVIAAYK